jgi:hypothetical protein
MLISNRLLMLTIFGLLVPLTLLGEVPSVLGIYPQQLSPGVRVLISGAGVGREATVLVGGRPAAVLGYDKEEFAAGVFEALTVPDSGGIGVRAYDARRDIRRRKRHPVPRDDRSILS